MARISKTIKDQNPSVYGYGSPYQIPGNEDGVIRTYNVSFKDYDGDIRYCPVSKELYEWDRNEKRKEQQRKDRRSRCMVPSEKYGLKICECDCEHCPFHQERRNPSEMSIDFFDKNQLLTTKKVPEWIQKSECKLVLSKNCRNTYEIACTSYNVIDVPIKTNTNMISGVQPTLTFAPPKSVISIGHLIKYFKADDNGYKDSEITILSMKAEKDSIMNNVGKIGGIVISRERNNKTVFYTTAKKFKGLESKVIIITDIDETCFLNEEQKRAFYVACSRATHRLALFIHGNEDDVKRISESIKGQFSAKGRILMKTKTSLFEEPHGD